MNALVDAAAPDPMAYDRASPGDRVNRGLFSALSREMCGPLISLRAGFDLLLAGCEGPISDEQRGQVQLLRTQCDDLIRLTRSYLDYAGLASGPRPLDLATFRFDALLAEADRQFSGVARARRIDWACRLDGPDAAVVTDLACFQQVVGRLVANALAHTPDGGRVEVSGRVDADHWRVEVADDGRGIPPQAIDRVFEPLVRLGAGVPAPCQGSGLGMGLAVCRELVARLGGEITLLSLPDRGTTASVRFPRGSAG